MVERELLEGQRPAISTSQECRQRASVEEVSAIIDAEANISGLAYVFSIPPTGASLPVMLLGSTIAPSSP